METTFKYQNKIITTPNLEKKLKRMKISINDIEIIETPSVKKEESNDLVYPLEWYRYYKNDDRWICRVSKEFIDEINFLENKWKYDEEYTKEQFRKFNERFAPKQS